MMATTISDSGEREKGREKRRRGREVLRNACDF